MARGDGLIPFNSETGREAQKKANEARSRNAKLRKTATFREGMRQVLAEPVTDEKQLAAIRKSGMPIPAKPTYRDFLIATTVLNAIKRGNLDDILKIMQITGEELAATFTPDEVAEDALSRSLRELAEEMEREERVEKTRKEVADGGIG